MHEQAEGDPVERVRRGYNALSMRYRGDDAVAGQYEPWIAELLALLPGGSRVLDLGCGCGVPVARDLAAAGHRVTGVDVSDVQIQRARRLVPTGRFLRADAATVALPPRSFEAVVALYSLIHMPLVAQPVVLAAIADWLVDDGLLLLTAGWQPWTGSESDWLGGDTPMWWSHADAATYRRWLERAGLEVLREERSARLRGVPEAPGRGQEQVAEFALPAVGAHMAGPLEIPPGEGHRPDDHTFALNGEDTLTVARDLRHSVLELGARPRPTDITAYLRRRVQIDERRTVAALGLT